MRLLLLASLLALALALAPAPALGQQPETEIASKEAGATAELVYTGLSMPVDIAFGPDGTLYYAAFEKGELRAVRGPGQEDTLWTAPDLELGGERGFVGLAVGPDGAHYVFYQTNKTATLGPGEWSKSAGGSSSIVSRLSKIVGGQETVLLDDIKSGKLHNSGRITFDHQGHLLVSVGDAILDTAGRQASAHSHDPQSLNGKVLRLNTDGSPAAGNPWGNEVWTKGHRNVYGLAVSPAGVVIGTENGPESWDEINVLQGGKDYGWPTCSGACNRPEYVDPLFAYESTIAPTGAVWHDGHFYFSDFNKGTVHRIFLAENGSYVDEKVLKFTTPRILDIAVGPDALYVSTWDSVWKLVPAKKASHWPAGAPPTPPSTPPSTQVVPDDPPATPPPASASPATPPPPGTGNAGDGARGIPALGPIALAAAFFLAFALVMLGERR